MGTSSTKFWLKRREGANSSRAVLLDVSAGFVEGWGPENRQILMTGYVYLAVAIVAEVVGTSALKATEGFSAGALLS